MRHKSATRTCLTAFIDLVSTQFSATIKMIRTDNGSEFNMSSLYASLGITHQTTCAETPQQNSIVERKHGHLLNITRALLFHSNLPKVFWNFVVCHSVHRINKFPTPVLDNKSTYELLYDKPPMFLELKVFGSLSYATTLMQNRHKVDLWQKNVFS